MPSLTIYCPGGAASQTGTAVRERYKDVCIETCGKIPQVQPMLKEHVGPFVIPIWNSHEGEVGPAEYVWNCIQDEEIKVTDAWAKRIEFWFVRRTGDGTSDKSIGSVLVAETQCAAFLRRMGASLVKCDLTTIAFEHYKKGALWGGVLVAPGQGEDVAGYEIIEKETANPNNFTSFLRFVPARAFEVKSASVNSWLTGVKMRAFGESLGDAEVEFLDKLLLSVKSLKEIPKLLFVFNREAKVGLLFEGAQVHAVDLLDADQIDRGDISVYENAGATEKPYTEELHALFMREFPELVQDDFILHTGVKTCLFACPPLGIFTHGYRIETVEPIVRYYISKLFRLYDDDMLSNVTESQRRFFERHREAWEASPSGFIKFKVVPAAST